MGDEELAERVSVEVSANETLARFSPGSASTVPNTSASLLTSAPPTARAVGEAAEVHDAVGRSRT